MLPLTQLSATAASYRQAAATNELLGLGGRRPLPLVHPSVPGDGPRGVQERSQHAQHRPADDIAHVVPAQGVGQFKSWRAGRLLGRWHCKGGRWQCKGGRLLLQSMGRATHERL